MILGVDLGTSGLKCVITNLNERIVCSTSTKLNINQFDGNCFEQNPEDWINATLDCFTKLQSLNPKEFQETISIGISGHMHGATLLDKDEKIIRPCILWNDTRSSEECIEFENQDFDVRNISGNITLYFFSKFF